MWLERKREKNWTKSGDCSKREERTQATRSRVRAPKRTVYVCEQSSTRSRCSLEESNRPYRRRSRTVLVCVWVCRCCVCTLVCELHVCVWELGIRILKHYSTIRTKSRGTLSRCPIRSVAHSFVHTHTVRRLSLLSYACVVIEQTNSLTVNLIEQTDSPEQFVHLKDSFERLSSWDASAAVRASQNPTWALEFEAIQHLGRGWEKKLCNKTKEKQF